MDYGIGFPVDAEQVAAAASNLRQGTNDNYTVADFLRMYPHFGATRSPNVPNVPTEIVELYIELANASVQQARWRTAWKIGMGLFVAHFCTKYLSCSVLITIAKTSLGTWTRQAAFEILSDGTTDYSAQLAVGNTITIAIIGDIKIAAIDYDNFGGASDQTKITLSADILPGTYDVSVDAAIPNPTTTGDDIVTAAATQGIITSESAGGVSYSMDVNTIMEDLPGFADWKSTAYGVQLATLAKAYGKGGMGIV